LISVQFSFNSGGKNKQKRKAGAENWNCMVKNKSLAINARSSPPSSACKGRLKYENVLPEYS
jgi:hypothetical protein